MCVRTLVIIITARLRTQYDGKVMFLQAYVCLSTGGWGGGFTAVFGPRSLLQPLVTGGYPSQVPGRVGLLPPDSIRHGDRIRSRSCRRTFLLCKQFHRRNSFLFSKVQMRQTACLEVTLKMLHCNININFFILTLTVLCCYGYRSKIT